MTRATPPQLLALCLAAALCVAAAPAAARCLDESSAELLTEPAPAGNTPAAPPADPRRTMQTLVRDAIERSHQVGAAKLLADAAQTDIDEVRAAKDVQGSLGGGFGPGGSRVNGVNETAAAQLRTTINFSQLLYDGGRTDRLTDWKTQLAESARYGHLSQQEQLALSTVALALERSRYRMQVLVWRQNVRRVGCLVEALETSVRNDRGRASELVQAQKTLEQAELSQTQTQSMVRQVEVRLRRLVGDGLPGVDGLSSLFSQVPAFEALMNNAERAHDIAQLDAQAGAARRYADAVAAQGKPQLSWQVSGNAAAGGGGNQPTSRSGAYSVGLMVSIPLLSPGVAPATDAARLRAQAALLQRTDALEARRFRLAEVYEQAQSSLDRARRLGELLRSSDQVRNFTLQQWQQLGRRSLFDVMGSETEHYNLRVAYVNALHDVQQMNANLLSLGGGVVEWLR